MRTHAVVSSAERTEAAGTVSLQFDVYFHHGPLVQSPLNLGSLPLIEVSHTDDLSGLQAADVGVLVPGAPPPKPSPVPVVKADEDAFP